MSARQEVLGRIRSALAAAPAAPPDVARDYEHAPLVGRADVDRFAEAVEEYAAQVHRTSSADLPAVVRALVGDGAVVVPHDLRDDVRTALGTAAVDSPDAPLGVRELDATAAVVTQARLGIALTGTVVLDAGPGQGRRALTLVPDHHVCVVRESDVVDTVPQAFAALTTDRPLTFVSGPSATSDIELDRVEGVHGPRTLDVVLVAE